MAAPCGQSQHSVEIHFAQRLASNEKKIRDRAIKRLRHWIAARSQKDGNISNDELMKLWKGLFYCMWMCDKPVVQEELADQIADMAHCFRRPGEACLFYETFLATMRREWIGIDHLRMDKYLMLIRRSFRQMLVVLHNNEWEEELVGLFLMSLSRCALNPDMDACPDGLRYQLANVYLDELAREGTEDLSPQQASTFLFPYAELVAKTLNKKLRDVMLQDIFQDVVERSNIGDAEEDEDEGIASDEERKKTSKKAVKQRKRKRKGKYDDEDDDDDEEEEEEEDDVDILEKVMFPEEMVPPLQYDYGMIADKLFDLASEKNIPGRNRKPIYRMVKRFQSLAKGVFPMPDLLKQIREEKDNEYLKDELPWWKKLQEKEKRKNRRRKRRRGKKGSKGEGEGGGEDDDEDNDEGEEDEEEEVVVKKKKKKVHQEVEEVEEMETDRKQKKKKEKRKEKKMTMINEHNEEEESAAPADIDSQYTKLKSISTKGKNKKGRKKREEEIAAEAPVQSETAYAREDLEPEPIPCVKDGSQKKEKKKAKAKIITDSNLELSEGAQSNTDIDSESTERIEGLALADPQTPRTKSKKKGKKKGSTTSEDSEDSTEMGLNIVSKASKEKSPLLEVSPKPFAAFDKVSTPVAYVKKAKKMTEPSTLPRTKAKSRVETQFSPPMTRKRVKIALSKNEFQPATDYKQRIKQSPGVPFDGSKKPAFSVLKQTPPKSEVRVSKVKGSSKKQGKVGKRRPKATDFF